MARSPERAAAEAIRTRYAVAHSEALAARQRANPNENVENARIATEAEAHAESIRLQFVDALDKSERTSLAASKAQAVQSKGGEHENFAPQLAAETDGPDSAESLLALAASVGLKGFGAPPAAATDDAEIAALLDLAAQVGLKGFVPDSATATPAEHLEAETDDPNSAESLLALAASVGLKGFAKSDPET